MREGCARDASPFRHAHVLTRASTPSRAVTKKGIPWTDTILRSQIALVDVVLTKRGVLNASSKRKLMEVPQAKFVQHSTTPVK